MKQRILIPFLLMFLVLEGCQPNDSVPQEAVQAAIDDWRVAHELVGVTVAIADSTDEISAFASGYTSIDSEEPLSPAHHFYAGSVTKSFTAAIVLQLADEGVLSLDDPLANWFPDYPNSETITVRQLLNMSSGTFDYFHASPENPIIPRLMADLQHVWTPAEIVETVAVLEPVAQTGAFYK